MKLNQHQIQHLLLRAGFGDALPDIAAYVGSSPEEVFSDQLSKCQKLREVKVDSGFELPFGNPSMTPMEKQEMRKKGRQEVRELNTLWLKEMVNAPSGLREKMAFFWHDHFACRPNNSLFAQQYLNVLRENALGNFGDLLRGVSKSAAMLQYLNNQQNRKKAPNENFAREVMELFTLGRDQGYTEKDISEAARAFTGWGFDETGHFKFRHRIHDEGEKVILGRTGHFDGEDVIRFLLEEKQTALHLSQKWVRFFVHPNGNPKLEKKVANALYSSGYHIATGLKELFTHPQFFKSENFGSRIKSPIELIVGMQRQLRVNIKNQDSLMYLQRLMGQMLFDPPNVAGWPDGKDWVDSATLMFRMGLPELVFKAAIIQQYPEVSFDDNDKFKMTGRLRKLEAEVDLPQLQRDLSGKDFSKLARFLLQTPLKVPPASPAQLVDQIVLLTSKPEYQLC